MKQTLLKKIRRAAAQAGRGLAQAWRMFVIAVYGAGAMVVIRIIFGGPNGWLMFCQTMTWLGLVVGMGCLGIVIEGPHRCPRKDGEE